MFRWNAKIIFAFLFGKFFGMNGLKSYIIPFKGASLGEHEYNFEVDDDFFKNFEASIIQKGKFDVKVIMDRKSSMLDLEFNISGNIQAPCDLCLAEIDLPIEGSNRILIKFDDLGREDTDEVIYIGSEEANFNIANILYEFISLLLPISRRIDCEDNNYENCDEEVLKKLELLEEQALIEEEEEKKEQLNIWDKLKDIKLN